MKESEYGEPHAPRLLYGRPHGAKTECAGKTAHGAGKTAVAVLKMSKLSSLLPKTIGANVTSRDGNRSGSVKRAMLQYPHACVSSARSR